MADYDTVFLKHFCESFNFKECTTELDEYNRLCSLKYKDYTIELKYTLGEVKYYFIIKDRQVLRNSINYTRNKYSKALVYRVSEIIADTKYKQEQEKIAELNTFLESIHS